MKIQVLAKDAKNRNEIMSPPTTGKHRISWNTQKGVRLEILIFTI
jgi:hypothetical protein